MLYGVLAVLSGTLHGMQLGTLLLFGVSDDMLYDMVHGMRHIRWCTGSCIDAESHDSDALDLMHRVKLLEALAGQNEHA